MAKSKYVREPAILKQIQDLRRKGFLWKEVSQIIGLPMHQCLAYRPVLGFIPVHSNAAVRRAPKPAKKPPEPPIVVFKAQPIPRGVSTLPPLPSLLLPLIVINYNK